MTVLPPPPRPPRALVQLLLLAAALRFVNLDAWSLWLDEGATWSWVTRPTWGGTVFAEANHPPLWWIVTRAWVSVFGDSAFSLRAPAAILGVLSVFLAWRLALRLLHPGLVPTRGGFAPRGTPETAERAALWFAGAVAASSYLIELSQEARMYALLLVETMGLSLLYLRWLAHGGRGALVALALVAAATLHTHYFGVWPVASVGAHALWRAWRTRKTEAPERAAPVVLALTAAVLLFVPWLVFFVTHYQGIAKQAQEPFSTLAYVLWRMGAGPALLALDRARMAMAPAALAAEEAPLVVVTAVLWLLPLGAGVLSARRRPGLGAWLLAQVGLPVLVLLVLYPRLPLLHERYLMFLAPWPFLLATLGATDRGPAARAVLGTALAVLLAAGTVAYHLPDRTLRPEGRAGVLDGVVAPEAFRPSPDDTFDFLTHGHPYGREPWREAHAFVAAHAEPGDLVCLHPHYLHLVWDHYDRGQLEQLRLSMDAWEPARVIEELGDRLRDRRRVFLILSHETTDDPDHWFRTLFVALGAVWGAEGAGGISAVRPVLFDLSWGVRVAVFTRS